MTDQPQRIGQVDSGKGDPTALTLDALQREIAQLLQLMESRMNTIIMSIADQKELRNAQLANIQQQISLGEGLRKELKNDNEKNIDRALAGVEKATEKLESNMTRTLGQVTEANRNDITGLRRDIDSLKDRINDNKERIAGAEQQRVGMVEGRQGMSDSLKLGIAMIGSVILMIGFFLTQKGGP